MEKNKITAKGKIQQRLGGLIKEPHPTAKENLKKVSQKRSLLKTLSWRCIASLDTFLLTWFVTGSPTAGITVSLLEMATKMVLYYFHERAWLRTKIGLNSTDIDTEKYFKERNKALQTHTKRNSPNKKRKSQKEIEDTIKDAVQDFFTNH